MAEEKTNGEEIYGGADGALERAEKSGIARRKFIKKSMKDAEKAKEELIKGTATDEVRLQGTKETKAPKALRPYVEKVNVVDRRALTALIEAARSEGRRWKVSRCLKEGYRYTFMTLHENEDEKAGNKAEPIAEPNKGAEGLVVDAAPNELLLPLDDADGAGEEPEKVLTAMDVLRGMFDISVTEDGRISICALTEEKPKKGEKPVCAVASRPATDDELAAIGILPGEEQADGAEAPSEGAEAPSEGAKKEGALDEASSAEKRAYRNGGEDAEDLYYGRVIARIKDKTLRDKVAKAYSGKRGAKIKGDAKTLLRKPSDEEEAKFASKQQKMQDKGYHAEDEYDDDDFSELGKPVEPRFSRKCPKCGKVDLNDAGECPLCDLGDESVLDEASKKKAAREEAFIKTVNSPVDAVDLVAELEIHDIEARMVDDGVMVPAEDYDEALDILMQMEMDGERHNDWDDDDDDWDDDDDDLDEARGNAACKGGKCRMPHKRGERVGIRESSAINEDAPIEGVEVRLDDLDHFKPAAGARETWDVISKEGKVKELAGILSDFTKDGKMTATDLNDMLWFERDWVLGKLGINGVDADGAFDVDAEEI